MKNNLPNVFIETDFGIYNLKRTHQSQIEYTPKEKLEIAVSALKEVNKHLTIPAAEYVPAIPEAWTIIEKALKDLGDI